MIPIFNTNITRRKSFSNSISTCIIFIIVGAILVFLQPKTLSKTAIDEGVIIELDTVECTINVKGERSWDDYKYKVQETYRFDKKDIPNIREFLANNKTDSINVRIWAEKWQARQIEMNGVMVKEYNWWKYAQPAFWLMILPGTVILILLILDRKRLLKEPEQKKSV